jgi:hypothetical protein
MRLAPGQPDNEIALVLPPGHAIDAKGKTLVLSLIGRKMSSVLVQIGWAGRRSQTRGVVGIIVAGFQ